MARKKQTQHQSKKQLDVPSNNTIFNQINKKSAGTPTVTKAVTQSHIHSDQDSNSIISSFQSDIDDPEASSTHSSSPTSDVSVLLKKVYNRSKLPDQDSDLNSIENMNSNPENKNVSISLASGSNSSSQEEGKATNDPNTELYSLEELMYLALTIFFLSVNSFFETTVPLLLHFRWVSAVASFLEILSVLFVAYISIMIVFFQRLFGN